MLLKILLVYLLIINAVGFLFMFIDKQKAKKKKWRIPEATLMGIAAVGGSIGSLMGIYTLRHKTLHKKFNIGIPAILILQIGLAVAAIWYF